jgi:hypothetical protein
LHWAGANSTFPSRRRGKKRKRVRPTTTAIESVFRFQWESYRWFGCCTVGFFIVFNKSLLSTNTFFFSYCSFIITLPDLYLQLGQTGQNPYFGRNCPSDWPETQIAFFFLKWKAAVSIFHIKNTDTDDFSNMDVTWPLAMQFIPTQAIN